MRRNRGSAFEREVCVLLSRWWSRGKRDDIFWRTAGSGARATVRRGRKTYGQYGDVQAVHPLGRDLLRVITIECKAGYQRAHWSAVLDSGMYPRGKTSWQHFIRQAQRDARRAGRSHWLIISRRPRCDALAVMPVRLINMLLSGDELNAITPAARIATPLNESLFIMRLADFLTPKIRTRMKRTAEYMK